MYLDEATMEYSKREKIKQGQIQDILVKKPQMGANHSKFIKSTEGLSPVPIIAGIHPHQDNLAILETVGTKLGSVSKRSVLSYQQKLS